MTLRSRKNIEIQERDLKILVFLWRWKVVTGPWIHNLFFTRNSGRTTVKQLNRLRAAGLINGHVFDPLKVNYWSISGRGLDLILDEVGPLESKVTTSEAPVHDLICSAVQLGQWQFHAPPGAGLISEQQLRSCPASTLDDWVPYDLYHRPDGYWLCDWSEGRQVVALEVELHAKSRKWYLETLNQYLSSDSIDYVVWVVGRPLIGSRITKFSQELGGKFAQKMIVLRLTDLVKHGWFAPIICQDQSIKSLHQLLHPRGYTGGIPVYPQYNFDTRLFPIKSVDYKLNEKLLCVNRVRI